MKKIFLTLAVVLGLGVTQSSKAQSVSLGIKTETNTSGFLLKNLSGSKSKLGFGASLGGFAKVEVTESFAIQPELLFHYKNSKMEAKETKTKFSYQYFGVEVPVYALGQFALGGGKFYAGVGPYVGFGINAKYKKGAKANLYKDDLMKRFDFGAGALIGYEFSNRTQINAGYKMGLINTLDKGKGSSKMRNQTISLGWGYRF